MMKVCHQVVMIIMMFVIVNSALAQTTTNNTTNTISDANAIDGIFDDVKELFDNVEELIIDDEGEDVTLLSSPPPSLSPSSSPSSSPPTTSIPTTNYPSFNPSSVPTTSIVPSTNPSTIPTNYPTITSIPSYTPTNTNQPSTIPSNIPTDSPIIAPSTSPSLTLPISYSRQYIQRLVVSIPQSFTLEQVDLFQFVYEEYTKNLVGYGITNGSGIDGKCSVLSQQIGINQVVRSSNKEKEGRMKKGIFHVRGRRQLLGAHDDANNYNNDDIRSAMIDDEGGENKEGKMRMLQASSGIFNLDNDTTESEGAINTMTTSSSTSPTTDTLELTTTTTNSPTSAPIVVAEEQPQSQPSADEGGGGGYPLTMRFSITYTTRIGSLDISDYNTLFADYVNSNLSKVTNDLTLLGLPIVNVNDVLLLKEKEVPTLNPSTSPVIRPTSTPSNTNYPTTHPSIHPTTIEPTSLPSESPSKTPPFIDISDVDVTDNSFVLGLSLGLVGAFMVSALGMLYVKKMDEEKRRLNGGRSVSSWGRPPTPSRRRGHPSSSYGQHIIRKDDPSVTMSKGTLDLTPIEDSPGHPEHGHDGGRGGEQQPQDSGATTQQQQQKQQRDEEGDYIMSPHHSMDALEGQVEQQEHLSPVQKRALQHTLSSPSSSSAIPHKKHIIPPPPRMFSSLAYSSPNTNSSNFSSPYEEEGGQQKQLLMFSPPTLAAQQQQQQSQQQKYDIENGNVGNSNNKKGNNEVLSPVVSLDGNELTTTTTQTTTTSPTDTTSEPGSSRRSMNYNNLFTLPYDDDEDSEYTRTPGGGDQLQQRGSVGPAQQQHPLLHRQNSSLATMPEHYWLSSQSSPPHHSGMARNTTNNRRITDNLMIHATSFSSSDSDNDSSSHHESINELDGSHDELDNYKNVNLEIFRTTIEQTVDGVDGMVSLAMTRALTVPDLDNGAIPWSEYIGVVGGVKEFDKDGGNIIEACCLCETYDWLKRHEDSSLDSINEYFQDILNRVVITVMFSMISPLQAANLVYGCANILGLDLLQELPQKTLIITGMRKTNDLKRGHDFIIRAFKPFGKIEEAAIAPSNRGFGFVRFAKPESVKRALKKYREFEIEIQDVSIAIKTLRSERPR